MRNAVSNGKRPPLSKKSFQRQPIAKPGRSDKPGKKTSVGVAEPRGPLGRRPGSNATRDDILDAAEEIFAAHGYEGTSLRDIGTRANINAALIQYYFGSKAGLYKAIFVSRGGALVEERLKLIDALDRRTGSPATVDEILRAFLIPFFTPDQRGSKRAAFIRLQSRLHHEPAEVTQALRTQVYQESIERCIAALRRALPDIDPKIIYWRMTFVIGAYVYAISDFNRLNVISHGECDPNDRMEALQQLITFLAGGLTAGTDLNNVARRKAAPLQLG